MVSLCLTATTYSVLSPRPGSMAAPARCQHFVAYAVLTRRGGSCDPTRAWCDSRVDLRVTSSKKGEAAAAARMPATLPPITTARLPSARTAVAVSLSSCRVVSATAVAFGLPQRDAAVLAAAGPNDAVRDSSPDADRGG